MTDLYYVYGLFDPRTAQPFYIGKGKHHRMFDHLKPFARGNNHKLAIIQAIRADGQEPLAVKLIADLSEELAYRLERSLILLFGRKDIDPNGCLTNNRLNNRPVMTDWVRKSISKAKAGKPLSESHKLALSTARSGKSWEDLYGTEASDLRKKAIVGRPHSVSTKKAISQAKIGIVPHSWSNHARQKLSSTKKGYPPSDFCLQRTREVAKQVVTCPHCGTSGNGPAMRRWHMSNCRNAHAED